MYNNTSKYFKIFTTILIINSNIINQPDGAKPKQSWGGAKPCPPMLNVTVPVFNYLNYDNHKP